MRYNDGRLWHLTVVYGTLSSGLGVSVGDAGVWSLAQGFRL